MSTLIQPCTSNLWEGAILGGIIEATTRARVPESVSIRQWVRNSYVVNGGDGQEGVITFVGGHWYSSGPMVAAFYDVHSKRKEKYGSEWIVDRFFQGCPRYQKMLAKQAAIPYLQLEVNNVVEHRVTAAFWDVGDALVGADPWDVLNENGADLVKQELTDDLKGKFDIFAAEYGATDTELSFAQSILRRKLDQPPALIELSEDEMSTLAIAASDEGIRIARQLFFEIGVILP